MKKKVCIMIYNDIYRRVKVYCAKNGIGISEFIENAVEMYLDRIEIIEEEIKNRKLEDLIEDKYIESVKQSVTVNEIGPREE